MSRPGDSPVNVAEFQRILTRINDALASHSLAIENLKEVSRESYREQIFQNTNRIAQIEEHLNHIRDDLRDFRSVLSQRTAKQTEPGQNEFPKVDEIEKRLDQLERLEKNEEYDQTHLERDFEILQREFDIVQRQVRDIEYKLNKR